MIGPFSQKPRQPVRTICASPASPASSISFFSASVRRRPSLESQAVPPQMST